VFAQNNQPLPAGYELEGYRFERQLSVGGFSIVYLAHDAAGTPVAIKEYMPNAVVLRGEGQIVPVIPPEFQADFNHGLKLFFEEGRALTGLDHPNVVRVLNFFRANETVYLVMRFETGQHPARPHPRPSRPAGRSLHAQDVQRRCSTASARCMAAACCIWTSSRPISGCAPTAARCCWISAPRATPSISARPSRGDVYAGLCGARAVSRQVHAGAVDRHLCRRRLHVRGPGRKPRRRRPTSAWSTTSCCRPGSAGARSIRRACWRPSTNACASSRRGGRSTPGPCRPRSTPTRPATSRPALAFAPRPARLQMNYAIAQETRIGGREINQDRVAWLATADAVLMVVADGMGGHLQGEVAAQIAVDSICERFRSEATTPARSRHDFSGDARRGAPRHRPLCRGLRHSGP
jgi:hypothetical protein